MYRIWIIAIMSLCSYLAQGKSNSLFYQVDLIVFTHQGASSAADTLKAEAALPLKGMLLKTQGKGSYHLLPSSASMLRQEYGALNRKPQYHVLLHYSWVQPANNQQAVILPKLSRDGWQVEGAIRVRKSNYYLLDANLFFSAVNSQASFVLAQKQRLKSNEIYYLDHPQAGLLIKVHPVS
jgi:hypothetical protein